MLNRLPCWCWYLNSNWISREHSLYYFALMTFGYEWIALNNSPNFYNTISSFKKDLILLFSLKKSKYFIMLNFFFFIKDYSRVETIPICCFCSTTLEGRRLQTVLKLSTFQPTRPLESKSWKCLFILRIFYGCV